MKLATRLNSILPEVKGDILEALELVSKIDGITSVDLNYPEHFKDVSIEEIKSKLSSTGLELNGIALRFRNGFINGDLGNTDPSILESAMKLSKDAADVCSTLGGKIITIWLGHDGFDYSFQLNYEKVWTQVKEKIQELADYNKEVDFSIEYKPYEERAYALIDSIGSTLLMVNDINRENVGVTVDYCHMLMKKENPAFSLSLANMRNKLLGVHINDGYGFQDNGLMIGASSFFQTVEFIYYLKKYKPNTTVYFDTFPLRENTTNEIEQNVEMFNLISNKIDILGMDKIDNTINANDGISAHKLMIEFLK